jgi:DNA-directed RNA polymerase subunit RPC12/RpoP
MAQQILEYKCPCCSGIIEFDSGLQQMKCPYCDTTFDPAALIEMDEALNNPQPDQMEWETPQNEFSAEELSGMNVYSCKSCGGEIVTDATTGATHCPFCGNPVVLTGAFSGALKPDFVIPFKVSKEQAKEALKNYAKGKKLVPKFYTSESHLEEIKGVYVPYWLYSADVDAQFNFRATQTRMWRTGDRQFTETSHFRLERQGGLSFENVPVDGSTKVDDTMMESLEPYDLSEMIPFQTAYLSGYFADKYDVDAEAGVERANERIRSSTASAFQQTVGGFIAPVAETSSIRFLNNTCHYALLPVWLLNTTYEGKLYPFAMNGQTGKLVGDLPVGKKEYWKRYLVSAGVCAVIVFLISLLFR